jgi:hypothetical protein
LVGDEEESAEQMIAATTYLFPLGVRLSTWLCLAMFVALAIRRRSWVPLFAAWVWLVVFEMAFDLSALGMDGYESDRVLPSVMGAFTLAWVIRTRAIRVEPRLAAATVLLYVFWLAIGFPWNPHSGIGFSWKVEVLNETVKTLGALACLVPLTLLPRRSLNRRGLDEAAARSRVDVAA